MGANAHRKVLIAGVVGAAVWLPGSALGLDGCGGADTCTVSTDPNSLTVQGESSVTHAGQSDPGTSGSSTPTGATGSDQTPLCVSAAVIQGLDPADLCAQADDDTVQLTPEMVAAAFRSIPLPASRLLIQPPNGRTLVNFKTNFYTDNRSFEVPAFQLLGHTIELKVTPTTYAWSYGDGTIEETDGPGAPYPDLMITHTYLQRGQVHPSVATTYSATYRVDGAGAWRPVDGTVTIAGEAAGLQVLTATPTLVGFR
jgi:hypothetical protein